MKTRSIRTAAAMASVIAYALIATRVPARSALVAGTLCPKPDAPAQFVDGEEPDAPAAAHGARGMVFVSVTLAADGSIITTSVRKTSQNAALDAAALAAAKEASYAPACRSGKPVTSTYLYVARFGS